ncbi:dna gyrase subunit a [Cystoisospora suis]|uniref:Dna gyrase subunit a n=1 Tax=Cystoisospora suis TaxID=483139 RepID=A0A2C6LEI2_9APIC|nr:dna gyrase subunit a [Cystoisospora suis]
MNLSRRGQTGSFLRVSLGTRRSVGFPCLAFSFPGVVCTSCNGPHLLLFFFLVQSTLLQAVGHMVASKFLEGVSSIRDESDWRGVRIVLVLRPEVEAQVVLSTLLKHTNLQTFVPINLIALDNHGTRPCRFSLKSMLLAWISFRFETLRRMLAAEREERERRSHLLEGLLRAVGHMDTVVKAVRESFSASEAHHRLTSAPLGFSPPQANALLRLTLSRLTGLERQEIQREHEEQMSRLNRLQELLNHDKEIYGLMIEELQEIRDAHKAARRTKIVQTAAQRRKAKQRTEVLNSKPGVQSGPGAVECRPPRGRNTQCAKDDETRSTAERNRSGSTEHSGESLPESTNNAFLQDDQAAAASQNNRDGTGARYPSQSAIGKEGRETAHLLTQERKNEQVRRPYGSPASCIRPESEGGQTRSCPSKLSGTEELESLEKDGTVLRSQEGSLGKDVGVLRNARETDSSLASGADRKVQENREEEEEAVVPFGEAQEIDEEDLIPSHQNVVLFSAAPYLRRLPLSQVPTLKRGAVGMRTAPVTPGLSRQPTESCVPQESDLSGGDAKVGTAAPAASEESRKPGTYSTAIHGLCVCRSRDRLLIVTREGFACSLPAYKIPLGSRLSRGVGLPQLLLTASRGKRKTARTGSQTGRTTGFHPEVPTKSCEDGGKESTRMDPGQAHLAAVLALPYSSAVRRDKKSNKWGGKIREPGQSKLIVATKRGMMAKIDVSLLLNRRGFTRGLRKVIACASGDCVVAAGIVEELGNEKTSSSGRLGMSARQERGRTVALVEGQAEQNVNGERKEPADRSSRERKEATEGSSEEESHFHRGLESPRHLTHSSRLNSDLEKGYTCEPADAFRHSKSTLLIVTRLGRAVHFSTSSVRETRTGKSRGVHAIRLKSGDSVIALAVVPPPRKREGKPHGVTLREVAREELSPSGMSSLEKRASGQECVRDQDPEDKAPDVLVVTTSGVGKRMSLSSLGLRKRGGTGVKIIQLKQEANAKRLLDRQQRVRPDEPAEGTHLRIPEQQEPRNHGDEDRAIIRRRLPDSGSAPQARPQGQSSAGRDKQEHVVSVLLVPCPRTHGGAQERGGQGDILLVSREGFLLRQVSGKVPVLRGRLARGVTLQNLQHSKRDDAIVAAGLAR